MRVSVYGVRGSIPVPGPTTLRYGGNSVHVGVCLADGTRILLDAGTGLRPHGKDLVAHGETGGSIHLLVSHLHYDHVLGLPFFDPLFHPDTELVIHPSGSQHRDLGVLGAVFDGVKTPIALSGLKCTVREEEPRDEWTIGSARVRRIALNHPGGADGFRIDDADGASLTYLTDNELDPPGALTSTPAEQAAFAQGTGLLIMDSQFLASDMPAKRGWGHSTVPQVLELGRQAAPLCQLLFHHDPDRSDAQLDEIAHTASDFARSEMLRGPVQVAAEGMRFDLSADNCLRVDEPAF